ncbi:MAG: YeeE/YedE thiosulfate transporter family protein [Bacillota bacterium]
MQILQNPVWSPYLVGAGIGVLSWISFLVSRKALGTSTSFARTAGLLERNLFKRRTGGRTYYEKISAQIDWQWMLVLGIVIGSFISAQLSGGFDLSFFPATEYTSIVNTSFFWRFISAFLGGVFLGFGSRFADGCTSGHGISGTLQLAVSSWIAAISFFVGGIIAAYLIF